MNTATLPSTPAVESVTTTLDTLQRIIAVHRAGADHDSRHGAVLSGVNVASNDHELIVTATSGTVLIEETFELSPGSGVFSFLLGSDSIKALAFWIKSAPKLKNKIHIVTMAQVDSRNVTFEGWGSEFTVRTLEGTFPTSAVANAFMFTESGPGNVPRACEVYGVNLELYARIAHCWDDCKVKVTHGRGLTLTPMKPGAHSQRALIMPISLPT